MKNNLIGCFLILSIVGTFLLGFLNSWFSSSGGTNTAALMLTSVLSLILFALALAYDTEEGFPKLHRAFALIWILTVLISLASLFFTFDIYKTVVECLRWMNAFTFFFATLLLAFRDRHFLNITSWSLVLSGVILGCFGIEDFIHSPTPTYLRFTSVLYEHNAFAGFLIIPLFAGFGLVYASVSKKAKILSILSTGFIFSTFILTFSRGAFVASLLATLLALFVFFTKKIFTRKHISASVVKKSTGVIVLACVVALCLYGAAVHVAASKNTTIGIYNGETIPESATSARIHYFGDAMRLIRNYPLGTGFGAYSNAIATFRTRPEYYSTDPHNIYLKFAAENGIVGGILLIIFFVLLLEPLRKIIHEKNVDPVSCALFLGILAVILHSALDIDFLYSLNLNTFFIAAGALYGYGYTFGSHKITKMPVFFKIVSGIFIVTTLASLLIFISDNNYQDGEYYRNDQKPDLALESYSKALTLFPFNSRTHIQMSDSYYSEAFLEKDPSTKTNLLNQSYAEAAVARKYSRGNAESYIEMARVDYLRNDLKTSAHDLEIAIALNPYNDLDSYVELAALYQMANRPHDVVTFTQKTIAKYPLTLFTSSYWDDPLKSYWKNALAQLNALQSAAYTKLGKVDEASASKRMSEAYQALDIK